MLDTARQGWRQRLWHSLLALARHARRGPAQLAPSIGLPLTGIRLALLLGACVRLALIPVTHGHDFTVWDAATRLILRGVNPYTHWQAMPNAYPYLPVFLYMLLPLQWLSLHTGLSFTILGKLPILVADLVIGETLYRWLRRAGRSSKVAVAAACLYLFNPLVLYNSAFLGRFDAVALAFLLPALSASGDRFSVLYGLAVATKTFPIFILPALLAGRYRRTRRELLRAAGVILATALPFLLWDPFGLVGNLTVRLTATSIPLPNGLSWQYLLQWALPLAFHKNLAPISYAIILALFLWGLLSWRDRPPLTLCALTFSAFLLADRKVWEQYLTWPLPFLIALALLRRDVTAWLLAGGLTLAALFMNEQINPVDHRFRFQLIPYPPSGVAVALALGIVAYIALALWPPRPLSDRAELRALP